MPIHGTLNIQGIKKCVLCVESKQSEMMFMHTAHLKRSIPMKEEVRSAIRKVVIAANSWGDYLEENDRDDELQELEAAIQIVVYALGVKVRL